MHMMPSQVAVRCEVQSSRTVDWNFQQTKFNVNLTFMTYWKEKHYGRPDFGLSVVSLFA